MTKFLRSAKNRFNCSGVSFPVLLFLSFSLSLGHLRAQVVTSTVSANWNTNSTWSTNSVPAGTENITVATDVNANTNVSISNSGTLTVNGTLINSGTAVSLSGSNSSQITINGTTTFLGCLTLSNTATLTINAGAILTVGCASFANNCVVVVNTGGTLIVNGNLTLSNATGITDNGGVSVNGNVTGSNSASVSGSGSLSATGTISMSNTSSIFGNTTGCSSCTINSGGSTAVSICGYRYNRRIRIDHTKVSGGSSLSNFPVYITTSGLSDQALFKSASNGGHVQNANGYDIVFAAADGVTPLKFQMENYVATTGEYEAWVNVPSVSATTDTYIYIFYGDASVTADQSSTATWNSNYIGVWHLDNNNFNDATSNGNNGTNTGSTNNASGQIVNARTFNNATSTAQRVQLGISGCSSGSGNGTIELWGVNTTRVNSTYFFGESSTQDGTYNNRIQLFFNDASGTLELGMGGSHTLTSIQTLSLNTWYHIVLSWVTSGTGTGTYNVYINGALSKTGTYSGFSAVGSIADIGNDGNAGQRTEALTGSVDEVHISNTNRSAGWITTTYNNQSSPSTFAIMTTEPIYWLGTTSTSWTGSGSNWSSGSVPASSVNTDIIIPYSATNQPTLDGSRQVGTLTVESDAILTLGAGFAVSVANDVINCGTITSASTGSLTCNSTSVPNQNISGQGTYSVGTFVINNTATGPTVTLNSDVTATRSLVLTSGLLNTSSTNILTLQNGATAPALTSASTSYVNGPLKYQKSTSGSTTLNFPVGKSPDCRPVALTVNHSGTTLYNYTGESFNANPWTTFGSTTTDMPSTVDTISAVHYVTIARSDVSGTTTPSTGLTGNQTIQMYFGTNDFVYQGSTLTIVKNTNAAPATWLDIGGSTTLGNSSSPQSGSVTCTSSPSSFTSFSSFALGSKTTGWNSLPIELLTFTATPSMGHVDINWSTQTETNNKYFTIERSADGLNFESLKNVASKAPNGTSLIKLNYADKDNTPLQGTSYYRLRQTDYNGSSRTFNVVMVNFGKNGNVVFSIYPNPSNGQFAIDFTGLENNKTADVFLYSIQGQEVYHKTFSTETGNGSFSVAASDKIANGTYLCTLYVDGIKYQFKVVIN